jgi:DNA polymerase
MQACLPFLEAQLKVISPKVIVAMGKTATVGLGFLEARDPLGTIRGTFQEWNGIPVMVTYHPAYLLRNPPDKGKAWDDLQKMILLLHGDNQGQKTNPN